MLKIGRTQLQDAVPMTLGQEFSIDAVMLGGNEQRLPEVALKVTGINPCATAVDTGVIVHPEYAPRICSHLAAITGIAWTTASVRQSLSPDISA